MGEHLVRAERQTTVDRALAVLQLFSTERPEWTVEAAVRELNLSQSTAYEYFRSLVNAGLLSTSRTGRYVIGPAIIELDRQTRRSDPLILAAREPMNRLMCEAPPGAVGLLCRLYRLTVMCVDQRAARDLDFRISYERGRPMPLDLGAASKAILAHLPSRLAKRYFEDRFGSPLAPRDEGAFRALRDDLRRIRRAGFSITFGELDPGRAGISAPIFDGETEILGSIGLVVSDQLVQGEVEIKRLSALVVDAGKEISSALRQS